MLREATRLKQTKRDRQTDRQTGRQTEIETDTDRQTQTDRQTDRQTEKGTERQRETETEKPRQRHTDRQTAQRQTGVATFRSTPVFNGRTFVSSGLSTEGTTVSASAELCWGRETDLETQTSEGKFMHNA